MIELIAVLVIIGIMAAMAISHATDTSALSVDSEAAILKNDLRFAQIKAMGDIPPDTWGINIGSGSYTLVCTGANCPATVPNLPGDNSPAHSFPKGISATPEEINFDTWGSPSGSTLSITLTDASSTASISVTPDTGFIQ